MLSGITIKYDQLVLFHSSKNSSKFVYYFASNLAVRQTDKQIQAKTSHLSFSEGNNINSLYRVAQKNGATLLYSF